MASRRGLGEIYRRPGSTFWWIRYSHRGQRIAESSKSNVQADAAALLKRRLAEIRAAAHVAPDRLRMTAAAAFALVENDYEINGHRSLADVQRRVRLHLTPAFGARRLSQIDELDVQRYILARQREGASNATINRELAIVQRAFALARVPRPAFSLLRESNVRKGFFSSDQLASVLSHLPADVRAAIELASITGWRVSSEVLPLEWRQVDLKAGEIRLDPGTTKNSDGRTFPITAALRRILDRQLVIAKRLKAKGRICPRVFHRDGAPICDFRKAWITACRLAGCPGRVPHDLRRTAVRNFVRVGIPQTVAMRLSGHRSDSIFRRYDIVADADLRVAASALNAASA